MMRLAVATMLASPLLGGALGLAARAQEAAPSPFAPLPRIRDSINGGFTPPAPAASPAATRRLASAAGRPAPFAVPSVAAVRPRAIASDPRPLEATPAPDASPKDAALSPLPDLSGPGASAAPVGEPRPPIDAAVQSASREVPAVDPSQAKIVPHRSLPSGEIAATVGAEQITLGELRVAMKEHLAGTPLSQVPPDALESMGKMVLEQLIQRTLVIQAAKVKLKNEKNWDQFMKQIERVWVEHEMPELFQKYNVKDQYELRRMMEKRGLSLDKVRDAFKLQTAASEFVRNELQAKIKVDLPEQRAYYDAHLKEFDRPAQVTWREVVVEVSKHKNRAEARGKAEAVLARLRRGDDFQTVAKAESEGPNARKGGLWETAPGSYADAAVNEALNTLPLGRISAILEGPDAYHVVRVEKRRQAGPASFLDVQLDIRDTLRDEKFKKGAEAFFAKLRGKTLITSPMFEGSPGLPPSVNATAFASRPATGQ